MFIAAAPIHAGKQILTHPDTDMSTQNSHAHSPIRMSPCLWCPSLQCARVRHAHTDVQQRTTSRCVHGHPAYAQYLTILLSSLPHLPVGLLDSQVPGEVTWLFSILQSLYNSSMPVSWREKQRFPYPTILPPNLCRDSSKTIGWQSPDSTN